MRKCLSKWFRLHTYDYTCNCDCDYDYSYDPRPSPNHNHGNDNWPYRTLGPFSGRASIYWPRGVLETPPPNFWQIVPVFQRFPSTSEFLVWTSTPSGGGRGCECVFEYNSWYYCRSWFLGHENHEKCIKNQKKLRRNDLEVSADLLSVCLNPSYWRVYPP